jgi:thioester reductase-like protein
VFESRLCFRTEAGDRARDWRSPLDDATELIDLDEGRESVTTPSDDEGSVPPNLAEDADLVASIALPAAAPAVRQAKRVLVSGLTGFLGGYVGAALLSDPARTVYGLARRRGARSGAARLAATIRESGGTDPERRLRAVEGELTEPRFGLEQRVYDELADGVDAVIHCAASVNLLAPYAALRRPNVVGTLELLRFAAHRKAKDVHVVSTVGVFLSPTYRGSSIPEDDPLTSSEGLRNGYSQSMWVADTLARTARESGLKVNVYRPAFVGWHSESGHSGRHDSIANLIQLSTLVGAAPRFDIQLNSVPVDVVASDITSLFEFGASNSTFHVVNSRTTNFTDLGSLLGLPMVESAEWAQRIGTARPAFVDFARAVCRAHDDDGSGAAELRRINHRDYRDDNLRSFLGAAARRLSPMDPEYLRLLRPVSGGRGA